MIRRVVDFALNNRLLVLGLAFILFVWGMISFHNLPIEAYPDVADNYVEIITQWPGISAEQIEQQVTIPLEIAMNGIPDVVNLRSFSLFGLSDLKLVFEDGSENAWNRERVLERLAMVRFAKHVGFSIAEIKVLLRGVDGRPPPERWRKLAAEKVAQVDAFVVQARTIRKLLSESLDFQCPKLVERGRALPSETARPALRLKRTARS